MVSAARLVKAGYVVCFVAALLPLLRPDPSNAQFPAPQARMIPFFNSITGNMASGMMMGGMMGVGGGGLGMGSSGMTGMGGVSALQLQLISEFGAVPVNGMMGMGGMGGFAGKGLGGFNGRNGL